MYVPVDVLRMYLCSSPLQFTTVIRLSSAAAEPPPPPLGGATTVPISRLSRLSLSPRRFASLRFASARFKFQKQHAVEPGSLALAPASSTTLSMRLHPCLPTSSQTPVSLISLHTLESSLISCTLDCSRRDLGYLRLPHFAPPVHTEAGSRPQLDLLPPPR